MKKIHYSKDADALLIELLDWPIAYAEDDEKIILHYSEDDSQPAWLSYLLSFG